MIELNWETFKLMVSRYNLQIQSFETETLYEILAITADGTINYKTLLKKYNQTIVEDFETNYKLNSNNIIK